MAYDKYGGVPGSHQTGPLASKYGFRVGTKESNTEVIDNEGKYNSALLAESLADYDVIIGGSVTVSGSGTVTVIDAASENYDVIFLVRVTTGITGTLGDTEFGFVTNDDAFGKLAVTALGATQIFTGKTTGGNNVTIVHDGAPGAGAISYVCLAKEL